MQYFHMNINLYFLPLKLINNYFTFQRNIILLYHKCVVKSENIFHILLLTFEFNLLFYLWVAIFAAILFIGCAIFFQERNKLKFNFDFIFYLTFHFVVALKIQLINYEDLFSTNHSFIIDPFNLTSWTSTKIFNVEFIWDFITEQLMRIYFNYDELQSFRL
jgi:hypothetical protein